MLDMKRIRKDPEAVHALLAKKHAAVDLDSLLALDESIRRLRFQLEEKLAERNRVSEHIAALKRKHEDTEAEILRTRDLGETIEQLSRDLAPLEAELRDRLLRIPNLPADAVPEGAGAEENVEVRRWGTPSGRTVRPHWDWGEASGYIDFERGRKVAGSRFTVLVSEAARLSRALINFMLDHAEARGYQECAPPYLVNAESMVGTGQFPKFVEDVFQAVPDDLYLIPTAEVPLVNLHRDEILREEALPIRYVAYTACFRSEAGSAGRDTRGLIRQHQFDKVELVQIVHPERSQEVLESLRRDAESVLEDLELPYRTVLLCGGDMGFGSAQTYDLEVWMPSYERYVEISSCSNMTDFQARRAEVRYRVQGTKRNEWVHTLNGSAVAVGRTLAALIENHQDEDGGLVIPKALQPYLGGQERIAMTP